MQSTTLKLKTFKLSFDSILQGKYFSAICACLVVILHSLNLTTVGFGLMMGMMAYCFFTQKDLLPILSILSLLFYVISPGFVGDVDNFDGIIGKYKFFVIVFSLGCVACIVGAIYHYTTHKKSFVKSKLLVPTIALCVCILLSGAFTPYYFSTLNFGIISSLIFVYLPLIFFVYNSTSRLTLDWVAKTVLMVGVVACIQLLLYYLFNIRDINHIIEDKYIRLGWAWHNGIGILIVACIPASFYLAYRHVGSSTMRSFGYIILALAMYCVQLLTLSRSSLMFGSLLVVVMFGMLFLKSNFQVRMQLIVATVVVLLIGVVVGFVFKEQVRIAFDRLLGLGFDDSERFDWWKLAIDVFKKYPIFGVGWEYNQDSWINYQPFFAIHSTPLQFLASTGLVGFLASVWLFVVKCKVFFKNNNFGKWFVLSIVIVFEVIGLIEVLMNAPYFLIIIFIVLAGVELNSTRLSSIDDKVVNDEKGVCKEENDICT
ncbi:MAG: O-antigen ligase family protein [Firmicutes bacterium]|nr:O-antigen ligase family protein [Bacillota bacterium]MCL1953426.1 O-antigen ligase family protein [Bacillota bacterium]